VKPSIAADPHAGLRAHLARLYPGHAVVAIEPLAPDTGATAGATTKAAGYGLPVRVVLSRRGETLEIVWRVASADEFGHDRRSDRGANQLLAYDDFGRLPDHVRALDVGVVHDDGSMTSIDGGELYLITSYAPGTIYADRLRAVARDGVAERDLANVDRLVGYLAKLHTPIVDPARYRRAIRDLVGHGEGIFGMVDGYRDDSGVARDRLDAIERSCVDWRRRLRGREHRLVRTHGDFHPFNIVFGDDESLTLLDASRGCCGDAADDVTALSINFILFALDTPGAWHGLGALWQRFWDGYLSARSDPELVLVVPPFFAWRALVVCNPRFYPGLTAGGREALLGLAERALAEGGFEPAWADELFR
jgi:hypothetical protein